jgi:hypothetical protein
MSSSSSSSSYNPQPINEKRKRKIRFGQNIKQIIPNKEETRELLKEELTEQGIPLKLQRTTENQAENEIGFSEIYDAHREQLKSPKMMWGLHRTSSNEGDINSQILGNTYANAESKKSKKLRERGLLTSRREKKRDVESRKKEEGEISQRESGKMSLEDINARGLKKRTRKNKRTKKIYNNKKSKKHRKNKKNK